MPPSCELLGGFAIGALVALLWQHYGNAWQRPAVILQAHRTAHALRMPAKTPLAGDEIDAPAACTVPFRPYCGGVATRTRNVSEYTPVLALCLVSVRKSACMSQKPRPKCTKFSVHVTCVCGSVLLRQQWIVLLVLWTTSCFPIIGHMALASC